MCKDKCWTLTDDIFKLLHLQQVKNKQTKYVEAKRKEKKKVAKIKSYIYIVIYK